MKLKDESYARLEREAERRGLAPEDLASALLDASLGDDAHPRLIEILSRTGKPADLDADAAMVLAYEELRAVRAEERARR